MSYTRRRLLHVMSIAAAAAASPASASPSHDPEARLAAAIDELDAALRMVMRDATTHWELRVTDRLGTWCALDSEDNSALR